MVSEGGGGIFLPVSLVKQLGCCSAGVWLSPCLDTVSSTEPDLLQPLLPQPRLCPHTTLTVLQYYPHPQKRMGLYSPQHRKRALS